MRVDDWQIRAYELVYEALDETGYENASVSEDSFGWACSWACSEFRGTSESRTSSIFSQWPLLRCAVAAPPLRQLSIRRLISQCPRAS